MAEAPKRNILDVLNDVSTSGDISGLVPSALSAAVQPPSVPTPLLAPSGADYAQSVAPKPSLGTDQSLQAPAISAPARESVIGDGTGAAPSSITLPAQTRENTGAPAEEQHPGFLKTLARIAGGAVGFTDPNSSPQASLGARIGALAGRTGNALAEAAGTPEQKQLANERSQMPLKMAQLQNEMDYRRAVVGNAANKTNLQYGPEGTSRMSAEASQDRASAAQQMADENTKKIEAGLNGEVMVLPQIAQMIGRPELAGKSIPPIKYQQEVGNVLKSLGTKTVDLGADGVWGASPLTGRITRLGESPSVARSNSMLLRTQLPVNDSQGNTLGWVNPQTNSFTPVGSINAKGGGAPLSASLGGDVIPPKPTSTILTQGQMASNILPEIQRTKSEITALGDKIGAAGGRWNEFWVNKAGVNDPDFSKVDQDLTFLSSAMAKAHFGGSPPEGIAEGLKKNFGEAQSPEDLNARIDSAEAWMSGYASRVGGTPESARKRNAATPPKSSTPAPGGVQEGATATGPNGHKITFSGRRWIDATTKQPIR